MPIEFNLPDLGENIEAGDVVSVLVNEGDTIQAGQNVLELETDKAVIELPCPHAGQVKAIHVKAGDHVPVGAPILTVDPDAPAAAAKPAAKAAADSADDAEEAPAAAPSRRSAPAASRASHAASSAPARTAPAAASAPASPVDRAARRAAARTTPASPSVRRMARELGIDLHQVDNSGPGGRITPEDVKDYVRNLASGASSGMMLGGAAPPLPDFSQWGPVERRPLRGARRKSAENLSLAWRTAPHVTQFDHADVTELEAARRAYIAGKRAIATRAAKTPGVQPPAVPPLTMTVLALKAAAATLQAFPHANSSLDPATGELIIKQYYHIGVAVDTEHGLIVPVVRDVNRKHILDLADEVDELARRARERRLELDEMRGGTFTISNLGGLGGTGFTPILNYPEVAILGIARARQEQVIRDGRVEIRTMLPLCLSYDHRVIDGADGVRILRSMCDLLADPMRLLLET